MYFNVYNAPYYTQGLLDTRGMLVSWNIFVTFDVRKERLTSLQKYGGGGGGGGGGGVVVAVLQVHYEIWSYGFSITHTD